MDTEAEQKGSGEEKEDEILEASTGKEMLRRGYESRKEGKKSEGKDKNSLFR